jgi:PilZ domain
MSNRRRSQRVLLRIPIQVIARGPDNVHVSESTYTVVVSAHGALIYLNLPVALGQVIVVKNPETGDEQAGRVAFRNTRADGKTEVGLEFVQPAPHFWRVSFPPSDWAPHHPEITGKTF